MGQTDATRVQVKEGAYTTPNRILSYFLRDFDKYINSPDTWVTITRTANFISKVEYFSDSAKTKKIFEHQYTRNVSNRVTAVLAIYYNSDGSEDSRVTHTFTRDISGKITSSANPFTTTEAPEI